VGNSFNGGTIDKPPVERDMDMAEAGQGSGAAGQRLGKPTRVSFMAASDQWERNKNGKRLRKEISAPVSAPGDWRSQMEGTVGPQVRKVTHLYQTIRRMARMLEAHTTCEEAQWLAMKEWLQDGETKWTERHKDDVVWGTGIGDMTAEVLAKATVPNAALAQGERKEGRDETARQDRGGLEASQQARATQDEEPEERQRQQQTKPKPKTELQLTLLPEPRQEPKPKLKPTPIPARRWETVQPQRQSQTSPAGPCPAPTTGLSKAERRLVSRRDECVPPPNKMDQGIVSAINRAHFH